MKKLFGALKQGLQRTRKQFADNVHRVLTGRPTIDEDLFEDLEEVLLGADVGVGTSEALLERLREAVKRDKLSTGEELEMALIEEVGALLCEGEAQAPMVEQGPLVVMLVGVNGTGKTTTLGKLAHHYRSQGKSVLVAAADTFRAAAVDQLRVWAGRADVEIVSNDTGADPASVAFDAIQAGRARGVDVVLVDTAGRLQTKVNLMEELKKINRVAGKALPGAPHEVLLVLDATTGQNAVGQARKFSEAVEVTGLVLTKLDGTAKGGVVAAIAHELGTPVRFIGLGEGIEDLDEFRGEEFARALFASAD